MNMMKDIIEKDILLLKIKENDRDANRFLVERYPWLCPCRTEDGIISDDYDYTWTELYNVPYGWIGMILDLCENIREVLLMYNIPLKYYLLLEVKEKYGGLRWYDTLMGFDPMPNEIGDLVTEAENGSYNFCILCGEPKQTNGYYCAECAKKV